MKYCAEIFLIAVTLLFASALFAQSSIPEIPFDSGNPLKLPKNINLGEVAGVATNSKGHIFVFTRKGVNLTTGTLRPYARGHSQLFEFNRDGTYLREIGQGLYGFMEAHTVKVDPQDNIWAVDQTSNMVIKFNPEGRVVMTFGKRPESIEVPEISQGSELPLVPEGVVPFGGRGVGAGILGDYFNQPSDVAWDAAGNIFIADGHHHGNERIAKFDKDGKFIKTWGSLGKEPGQFYNLHSIAVDAKGNVYGADRQNHRIQVFDNDGNFKSQFVNVGADPGGICISPGPHQYLYVADMSTEDGGNMDNGGGEIYKLELDGTILGKIGKAGRQLKEFYTAAAIDCRSENELYIGEYMNWRVQKITLHPNK